jgi:hypothetical protein
VPATFADTDFQYFVTAGTGSAMTFMMICYADDPVCGGSPASISYSTLPNEWMSDRALIAFSAVACSGDM